MAATNDTGRDVELAAQLGHRLLARYASLDRRSLELCAEDASAVCLPPVFAHGASRCILRPHGEQSKRGALHHCATWSCGNPPGEVFIRGRENLGPSATVMARLGLRRDSGSTRASSRSTSGSYDSCSALTMGELRKPLAGLSPDTARSVQPKPPQVLPV